MDSPCKGALHGHGCVGHFGKCRDMRDEQILVAIKKIVEKGNNAEVKRRKGGSLVVYEVKKQITKINN